MTELTLSQLFQEIQKFSTLRISEQVHSAANGAISDFNESKIQTPIENSDNNVVKFIVALFKSKKFNQPQTLIYPRIIKAIESHAFTGDALESIISSITLVANEFNNEQSMQILQLITSYISYFFPSIPSLESIFTIVLTLIARKDVLISTTAYAYFPQILDSLKQETSKDPTDDYIQYCQKNYQTIFQKFEKPYNFIYYLLYSDLTNIALKQKMTWLVKLTNFPTLFIYDLLDLIVNQYSEILLSEPQLICIFDGVVIQSMSDQNALPFIICFIDRFLESNVSLCTSLFEDFLSHISSKNKQNYKSLFFFREISTRNQSLPLRLFENCDKVKTAGQDSIFVQLITSLHSIEKSLKKPTKPLIFLMKPARLDSISSDKGITEFRFTSPSEIIFGILKSFVSSKDSNIEDWVKLTYLSVMEMLKYSLKYSTLESLEFSREAITNLLIIMHSHSSSAEFDKIFQIVCSLSSSFNVDLNDDQQQIFQSFDKQGVYNQYLCRLAETHPEICSGRWLTILSAIFKSKTNLSLNFAADFDPNELQSIVEVVIALTPLPYDFIATLVSANMKRFDVIWVLLKPFFNFNISEEPFDENVLNLLIELMSRSTQEENEEEILNMAYLFVCQDSPLNIAYKGKVLLQLRHLLAENAAVVKKGWIRIFNALQPSNFDGSSDTIQSSFNILTLLCNDDIQLVPESSMKPLIEVIFKFADNEADINVSLSSFDLLWGVVRVMENSSDNWTYLMSEVLRLIKDKRNDVSQCAIRTFFSLMSSNFGIIPSDVINVFVSSSFAQILNCIDYTDSSRAGDFELALQEMSHYTSTFWPKFDENPDFKKSFIPLLIKKATSFCSVCDNQELVTNAFQLYQNLFECAYLDGNTEGMLRMSLTELTEEYVKINDNNSIIFPCFGRLIGLVLISLKTRNAIQSLVKWFPLIREIVTQMMSPIYVHITVQRTLDAFPSLFPMKPEDEEVGYEAIGLLVEFAMSNSTTAVCPFIMNILIRVFDAIKNSNKDDTNLNGSLNFEYLVKCKPLIMLKASEPLLKVILQAKINYKQSDANEVFDCFTTIKKVWPSLQHLSDSALVMLIDKASQQSQRDFIDSNSTDLKIIELFWKNFLDPSSENFNNEVANNCTELVINAVRYSFEAFVNKTDKDVDEKIILNLLEFLNSSKLPAKTQSKFPENCLNWHLVILMKEIVSVVDSDDENIRKTAKKLLNLVSDVVIKLAE